MKKAGVLSVGILGWVGEKLEVFQVRKLATAPVRSKYFERRVRRIY